MRTLVIETATPVLSVALFDHDRLIASEHRTIGRGHAEMLVPVIASLPDGGRAARILVSCGPGSFTGIRIGIAAARALASAWGATLLGYDTLALIGRHAGDAEAAVAIFGGHGEYFVSSADAEVRSMTPAAAAESITAPLIIGSAAADLIALRGYGEALVADADARLALALPPAALFAAEPLYGRRPDAVAAA